MNKSTSHVSVTEISEADLAAVTGGADAVGGAVAGGTTLLVGLALIPGGAIALGLAATAGALAAWIYADKTQ